MNWRKNQSFWTSVIFHIVVVFALFLATIIEAFKPKEEEHVFVMVDPPSTQQESPSFEQTVDSTPPESPIPDMPALQEIPDLPTPTPQPPKPTPPTPKPTPPTPKPTPTPAPEQPKRMTEDEYRQRFGDPKPRIRTPQPTTPSKPDVKIHTERLQRELQERLRNQPDTPTQSSQSSQQMRAELAAYNQRLSAMLTRAWNKPSGLSGVSLVVEVIFYVAPNGRISNIRLNPSSGNQSFDQSVLAAFQKVGSAGPTPTGDGHTFTKRFRMTD